MAIITIFSGPHCHENEVAENVARRLGYELIDDTALELEPQSSKIPREKLIRAMRGAAPFFDKSIQERNLCIAHIQAAVAGQAERDNIVFHGFAGHLLPRKVDHIVRVCLMAELDYRIARAMEGQGLTKRAAQRTLKKDDDERKRWTRRLFNLKPWDDRLYDIKIPMHATSVKEAEDLICENVQKDLAATTPESQKEMVDFAFTARVNIALLEKGHNLEVLSDDGNITLIVAESVFGNEPLREQLKEIAGSAPGVRNVEIIHGTDAPKSKKASGVLLVDDEREFAQTLSERLQMRDLSTAIAHDGEEALSHVEKTEPEVMVLDLKMPGIDGIEVLRRVKERHPKVEVIILTGHGTEEDKALTLELGAFAFLEKPVEMEILAKTVRDAYEKVAREKAARKLGGD